MGCINEMTLEEKRMYYEQQKWIERNPITIPNYTMTERKAETILNAINGWTQDEGQALQKGAPDEKELFLELLKMYPNLKKKYKWYENGK